MHKKKHFSDVEIKTQNGWNLLGKPWISVYNRVSQKNKSPNFGMLLREAVKNVLADFAR